MTRNVLTREALLKAVADFEAALNTAHHADTVLQRALDGREQERAARQKYKATKHAEGTRERLLQAINEATL